MASIKISKKYGVNPTIPICCWCGKEKNEIALLGKITKNRKEIEAPRNMVLDYEPCDTCKKQWDKAVIILSVTTNQPDDNRMPIQERKDGTKLYPTLDMAGITEDAAERLLGTPYKYGQRIFMEDASFNHLFGNAIQRGESS